MWSIYTCCESESNRYHFDNLNLVIAQPLGKKIHPAGNQKQIINFVRPKCLCLTVYTYKECKNLIVQHNNVAIMQYLCMPTDIAPQKK